MAPRTLLAELYAVALVKHDNLIHLSDGPFVDRDDAQRACEARMADPERASWIGYEVVETTNKLEFR